MSATTPAYRARRTREIAYGTWTPFIADSDPVREHVRQLRERTGATYRDLAAAASLSTMAVHAAVNGAGQIRAETAAALLNLTPERIERPRVAAAGTTRRVRALIAMGHTCQRQAQALGCHSETVQKLARGGAATVPAGLWADAERLYDAWWDKRPPERTRQERRAAEAARRRAERSGWCTGGGLDDERIDDPGYLPRASWRRAEGAGLHRRTRSADSAPPTRWCGWPRGGVSRSRSWRPRDERQQAAWSRLPDPL